MNTSVEETTVAGTYEVKVHTPLGDEKGILNLVVDGNSLSGSLENKKGTTEFRGGTVEGNEVKFDTKIRTPMGRLKGHITGKVEDGTFTGAAKLPLGTAEIEGKRK